MRCMRGVRYYTHLCPKHALLRAILAIFASLPAGIRAFPRGSRTLVQAHAVFQCKRTLLCHCLCTDCDEMNFPFFDPFFPEILGKFSGLFSRKTQENSTHHCPPRGYQVARQTEDMKRVAENWIIHGIFGTNWAVFRARENGRPFFLSFWSLFAPAWILPRPIFPATFF